MKKFFIGAVILLAAASCSPKTFSIVQIADAQLGFDAAVKGQVPGATYVNDLTYEKECFERAAESISGLKPEMIVFTGDQIHRPLDQEQWDAFGELLTLLPDNAIVKHLPGNHDLLISEGKVDSTPFTSRYGEDHFAFTNDKFCVIGLNSSLVMHNDPKEEEQFEWLVNVLESAPENSVKVIFCHHPFFVEDIDEEDGHVAIPKAKRRKYFDLFADKGVSAVYAGHLHHSAEGEYRGVSMKTATSVGYQLGEDKASYRLIYLTIRGHKREVVDVMVKTNVRCAFYDK
jgi:3',5'-cyclic AMP phosphodiesterase CpdA